MKSGKPVDVMPEALDRREVRIISPVAAIQAAYEAMLLDGQSHPIAEMLALQQPPSARGTDSQFWKGRWGLPGEIPTLYRKMAEAQGVSTTGKFYSGQLAKYPGDPRAWVSSIGDVTAICRANGWGCSGAVDVPRAAHVDEVPEATGPYRVAPDIVAEKLDRLVEAEPEMAHSRQQMADAQEKLTLKLSGGKRHAPAL